MSKYERDNDRFGTKVAKAKLRRVNRSIKKIDNDYRDFVTKAQATDLLLQEEAGFLEPDNEMEKTHKFLQHDVAAAVDVGTSNKKLDLQLPELGPYCVDFTRNGRKLLIGGKKGHVASMDWQKGTLDCELFLNETVHAVQYFERELFFAVAQKRYTFVYNQQGVEVHRLKQHQHNTLLQFLPYHYLLVGGGMSGRLKYHDVSTGVMVGDIPTKMGPTQAMKQNPWNAVMHLGHGNGTVSLWSPTVQEPLVKMQCNRGPIRDLAVDREGKYMVVSGLDKRVKVWDLRMYKELDSYTLPTPASSVDVSDTGLVALAWGPHVTVWKDLFSGHHQTQPYMMHMLPSKRVQSVRFVPFEDILGLGHTHGVQTMIVPGAGEANFDAMETNPYESAKQRQEAEVHSLLNKLPHDTIALDPSFIGTVDARARHVSRPATDSHSSNKAGGAAKENNIVDERKMRTERNIQRDAERKERMRLKEMGVPDEKDKLGPALGRFV